MNKKIALVLVAVVCACVTLCLGLVATFFLFLPKTISNETFNSTTTTKPELTFATFPRIDSSTSNQHIVLKSYCALTNTECKQSYSFEGEAYYTAVDSEKIGKTIFEQKVKTSKTHDAYINLINNDVDVILVATLPSEAEQAEALKKGVKLKATPIAKDAFVFMNNYDNPLKNLTLDEVIKIYSGEITNWKQLGVSNEKINAYVRGANSGSQEMMKSLVMKNKKLIEPQEMMFASMMGLVNRIENDAWGIGYSFYFYKTNMTNTESIRLLKINGVLPNKETIRNNKYPLITKVYLVTRDEKLDSSTQALKDWLMTPEGQDLIEEVGYVRYQ